MRWITNSWKSSSYLPLSQSDRDDGTEGIELLPEHEHSTTASASPWNRASGKKRTSLRLAVVAGALLSLAIVFFSFGASSHSSVVSGETESAYGAVPPSPSPPHNHSEPSVLDSPPGTPDGWYFYTHNRTFVSPHVSGADKRTYHRTRGQRILLDPKCAEQWVARGTVCNDLADAHDNAVLNGDDGRLDVIWTWVNGSDPYLAKVRAVAVKEDLEDIAQKPEESDEDEDDDEVEEDEEDDEDEDEDEEEEEDEEDQKEEKPIAGSAEHHFRDHDELRYSMRSVYQNVPAAIIRKLHLFTSSLPYEATNSTTNITALSQTGRMGHVPTWLNLTGNDVQAPAIGIIHHWENFRVTDNVLRDHDYPEGEEGAKQWRGKYLPTFNSLSIESQFPHIEEFKDTLLYLNDDYFITRHMSTGDFATYLYGPVFRIQRNWNFGFITDTGWYEWKADMEGEAPTLEHANWYLNDRFGGRRRGYIKHVARSMDVTILRELNVVWPDVLATTASSRFRGHTPQVHLAFLQMYYHIEKHREALLYSFLVLRADQDQDGRLTPSEAQTLLNELAGKKQNKGEDIHVDSNPVRTSEYRDNIALSGETPPKETKYLFTSADGYPYVPKHNDDKSEWPAYDPQVGGVCRVKWDCFNEGFGERDVGTQDLFKRWMFMDPTCGDCAIVALLGQSGSTGLEAFLPRPRDDDVPVDMDEYDIVGGNVARWWYGVFDPTRAMLKNPRAFAIRNIQRYSYVLGDTPMKWLQVKDTSIKSTLDELKSPSSEFALVAINDDVKDGAEMGPTDKLLRGWYHARWSSVRGWWEGWLPDDEDGSGGGLFSGWW
ncbi:hypothetical protein CYLTODRAFT_495130 [Cylindrobasidium torrendii FP15055 ss-10]|uniref:Stealth protein CR3 conserved region 3 domain-containing protein n=1 Tax=Cylindrobasidium torrendii FP15055 ss-10 TaxID=1314674 RepID=A0A0D7AV22_9AGAR|nr:hypothetical protein CYLTODRAFT_495130 [Cylindrobasidium torrendii FP15055 ss-10]